MVCLCSWVADKGSTVKFTASWLSRMLSQEVLQDLVDEFEKDNGEIEKEKFARLCEYMYAEYYIEVGHGRGHSRCMMWDMAESELLWDLALLESLSKFEQSRFQDCPTPVIWEASIC